MDVGLEFVAINIRQRRKKKKLDLSDFDNQKANLLDVAKNAFSPLATGNYKGIPGKSLKAKISVSKSDISGVIFVGDYGLATDVVNVTNGKTEYKKEKHHAEQIPFFIRLYCYPNSTDALLIMQRMGGKGIFDITKSILLDYFKNAHPDYIMDFRLAVPDYALSEYFKNGTAKSITFVKHSIPSDIADKVSGAKEETKGSIEYKIKASKEGFFRKSSIRDNIKNPNAILSMYTFDEFAPDQIKLTLLVGGRSRTINILDNRKIKSTFDITDDVSMDISGYPNQKEIKIAAHQILAEMAPSIGIKV